MNNILKNLITVCGIFALTGLAYAAGPDEKADTSWINKKWLDIPYANQSPTQKLDIYIPDDGTAPFPVIISIHGGAFKFGDKADGQITPMLEGLKRGYAVVSVNYRLSGEAKWPAAIYDVKAAIRCVKANAVQYGLNPEKIAVWGGSAGGNLSALAGTSADVPALEDKHMGNPEQSTKVQAVIDWFGPIDFLKMDDQFKESGMNGEKHSTADSFESQMLGKPITEAPDLVKAANPETYITPHAPPFFIQHGTKDTTIPSQQSANFAAKLTAVIGTEKVTFEYIQDAGHGDPKFLTPENLKKVLDFLDTYLK
jgi:acetyl esterase/lipase